MLQFQVNWWNQNYLDMKKVPLQGAMPLHMQAKLLRVLEEKEGGYYPIPVDIRIIEALNKDLKKASKSEKKFREDLYYRLNVINIRIPPLRERKEDIMVFSNYFFRWTKQKKNKAKVIINKKAQELLMNHKWDGNIRELKKCDRKCLCISGE